MIEINALTLDQIRLFVAVADDGSFSATARRTHRAQSAVSYGIANLEANLDLQLFDRSGRKPTLTKVAKRLLADARVVLSAVDQLGARASAASEGLEHEVSIAVDASCPTALLVAFCRSFQARFPSISLRVHSDVLEAIPNLVLSGACIIGIAGPFALHNANLVRRFLTNAALIPVAAAGHPLSSAATPIRRVAAEREVQIVLSQRARSLSDLETNIFSTLTWHVADVTAKYELISAGLGWGYLPTELVREDIEKKRLIRLVFRELGPMPVSIPLASIYHASAPPGPAARWLLDELSALCAEQA